MTAKEFLNQPYELQKRIRLKEQRKNYYRELAGSVSSPGFEEHYSASKNTDAPFVRYLEKVSVLEEEIKQDKISLSKLKDEVDHAIDCIEDSNEEMVLRYRYVMLISMKQIARQMNYTLRWVQLTHAKAIAHFESFHIISP